VTGVNGVTGVPPRSPLDLDRAAMQALGRRVADLVAEHLATLRDQPVIATGIPADARRRIAAPPPEEGAPFDALLDALVADVLPYAAREPHPGFMGYVPGCPTFPAVLGDWLATGYNLFAGVWPVAEGPNALELAVLDWFRAWVGMPAGTGGLLTNGGSGATLTAVVAARHAAAGDDAARLPRLTLYASDQAHSAVQRAAWIAGVPRGNVRALPADERFRLRVPALRAAVAADRAAGLLPFAVAVSAGTTNTGAVDPIDEVADFCEAEGLWLHADAAYGGFAALTRRGAALLAGLGRCDSVALDPHKWLFVPFECGCLLARDPERLRAAFAVDPDYLRDVASGGGAFDDPARSRVNFADYGEQLTRQSRALKVWLGVRYFGVAALRDAMDRAIDLAAHAERLVRAEPALEVLSPAQLGIVCFRARPGAGAEGDAGAADALNERVNAAVNATGRFLVSSTRLRGALALRLCVLGYRTTAADVEGAVRAAAAAAAAAGARAAA
jgi:glutamate/tyrosine decarboxylase-like PLP-dependent enzyme